MTTTDLSYQLRQQTPQDMPEINRLMGLGFAPSHAGRAIWQLRQGAPVLSLSLVADAGDHLLGSIRYWPIIIGGRPSILLGPLAVDPDVRGKGIGVSLVRESLHLAGAENWEWCFISGEPDYYLKFGFKPVTYDDITLPAHIEPERLHLLALPQAKPELMPEKPWVIMPSDPAASDASDNKDDVRQAKDVS